MAIQKPKVQTLPLSAPSTYHKHAYTKWVVVQRLGTVLVLFNLLAAVFMFKVWRQEFYGHFGLVLGLAIAVNVFLFGLGVSNPGVVPKKLNSFEFQDERNGIPKPDHSKQKYREILLPIDTTLSRLKFCEECKIFRPRRTIHCSICNRCILQFDHHCEWIGVCIGKNNYCLFILTIIVLTATTVTILIGCIRYFVSAESLGFYEFIRNHFWMMLITIVSGIFSLGLNGLLVYHLKLLWQGLTTNEDLKKMYGGDVYPFPPCSTWSWNRAQCCGSSSTPTNPPLNPPQQVFENLETEKRGILLN